MTSPGQSFACGSLPALPGNAIAKSFSSSSCSSSNSASTSLSTSGHSWIHAFKGRGPCVDSGSSSYCYCNSRTIRENCPSPLSKGSKLRACAGDLCPLWNFISADSRSPSWLNHAVTSPRRVDRAQLDYQLSRKVAARRIRRSLSVRNGELRNGGSVDATSADLSSVDTHCVNKAEDQFGALQTRRDILIGSSSALGLAAANLWGLESAKASGSQQVRLEDVEDQKLQEALRAAVSGDLENAENLFTELIRMDPESASVWSNRGSVRVSLGKYKLASDDFTKAIELAPSAPVPYLNRAISYEAQGFYDEAIADCKSAIQNDPEEPAAWFNLGNVEARVKDFEASLLAYQKASDLAPGIAGYRLKQALILFQLGRMEEAKKLIQGLVRKYPNYTEAHAALAALLWNVGQRSKAEEQFSTATNQEPSYNRLSWVESELQWPPGVVQAFAKFLSIDYSNS